MKPYPLQKFLMIPFFQTNKAILHAIVLIGISTLCIKLVGFGRDMLTAYYFGVSSQLDTFIIAFIFISFFTNIIASSINSAVIPTYVDLRKKQNANTAQIQLNNTTVLLVIIFLLTSVLLYCFAFNILQIICPRFSLVKLQLTASLFKLMLPTILLNCIASVWSGILNAHNKFTLPALAPGLVPLAGIISFLFIGNYGITCLAYGVLLGSLLQVILLGVLLQQEKVMILPKHLELNQHSKTILKQFAALALGSLVAYSSTIIDQSMASYLGDGQVAIINYANKLIALPLTIIITALSTAIFPYFSKLVASQDWENLIATLKHYLHAIFSLGTLACALIFLLAKPLIIGIFQRGSFTTADTIAVTHVLQLFSLQLPFYISSVLIGRALVSMKQSKIVMLGAFINMPTNIVLNLLFMHYLGTAGIALSTSITYLVSFIFLYACWNQLIKNKPCMAPNS